MSDIKVSVILAIYNASDFLNQTLNCLENQTLKDIEIICVDDGSSDESYKIIEEHAKKDSRIVAIKQENAGAGAARNTGLGIAKGEYLSFLDSDDFFEDNMLELAYNHAKMYDSDVTVFNSNQYYEETGEYKDITWVVRYGKIPPYNPFKHRQMTDNVFKVFVGWAWDKLFKKSFVDENDLKFQEQRTSNDLFFVFSAIVLADRISVLEEKYRLVHQRRNNKNSLSNTREKSWDCFYKALIALRTKIKQAGLYDELEQDYINYALHFSLWNLNSLAEPTYSKLKDILSKEWYKELGVSGKEKNYFYNKSEYDQYEEIFLK